MVSTRAARVQRMLATRGRWRDRPAPLPLVAVRVIGSTVRRQVPRLATPTVRVDHGFSVTADLRTPLGLRLYRYGLSHPELALVEQLLEPGDVFVDGGAHVGLFSLTAAAVVGPQGRVIACEPEPGTAALLAGNIELNRFSCVEVHQVALAERSGAGSFSSFGPGCGLNSFAPATSDGASLQTVEQATIDEVAGPWLDRVRVVKLDLEGAELRALQGASRLLRDVKPDLIVEVEPDHLRRQGASAEALHELLEAAGYRPYRVQPGGGRVVLTPLGTGSGAEDGSPNLFFSARSVPARIEHPAG